MLRVGAESQCQPGSAARTTPSQRDRKRFIEPLTNRAVLLWACKFLQLFRHLCDLRTRSTASAAADSGRSITSIFSATRSLTSNCRFSIQFCAERRSESDRRKAGISTGAKNKNRRKSSDFPAVSEAEREGNSANSLLNRLRDHKFRRNIQQSQRLASRSWFRLILVVWDPLAIASAQFQHSHHLCPSLL